MSRKTARRHARQRARRKAEGHQAQARAAAVAEYQQPSSDEDRPLLPDELEDPDGPWTPEIDGSAPPRPEPLDPDTRDEIIAGVRTGLPWIEAALRVHLKRDALAAHLYHDPDFRDEMRAAEIEVKVHYLRILYEGRRSENVRAAKWFLKCRYPAEYDPLIVSACIRNELKAELKAQEKAERAAVKAGRATKKRRRNLERWARHTARTMLERFRQAAARGDREAIDWLAKHEHKSPEAIAELYVESDLPPPVGFAAAEALEPAAPDPAHAEPSSADGAPPATPARPAAAPPSSAESPAVEPSPAERAPNNAAPPVLNPNVAAAGD